MTYLNKESWNDEIEKVVYPSLSGYQPEQGGGKPLHQKTAGKRRGLQSRTMHGLIRLETGLRQSKPGAVIQSPRETQCPG